MDGIFSRIFSTMGIQKSNENRKKAEIVNNENMNDKNNINNNVTDIENVMTSKKISSSPYKKIFAFFGLKLPKSEYEQYELVQSYTDSFGVDPESDTTFHPTSNESSETETVLRL